VWHCLVDYYVCIAFSVSTRDIVVSVSTRDIVVCISTREIAFPVSTRDIVVSFSTRDVVVSVSTLDVVSVSMRGVFVPSTFSAINNLDNTEVDPNDSVTADEGYMQTEYSCG
jgi:hypothetical protein